MFHELNYSASLTGAAGREHTGDRTGSFGSVCAGRKTGCHGRRSLSVGPRHHEQEGDDQLPMHLRDDFHASALVGSGFGHAI